MPWALWLTLFVAHVVLWLVVARSMKSTAARSTRAESLVALRRRYEALDRELVLLSWAEATTGTNEAAICRARDISFEMAALRHELRRRSAGGQP